MYCGVSIAVSCNVVLCGVVQSDVMERNAYRVILSGAAQCNAVWCCVVSCSMVQSSVSVCVNFHLLKFDFHCIKFISLIDQNFMFEVSQFMKNI